MAYPVLHDFVPTSEITQPWTYLFLGLCTLVLNSPNSNEEGGADRERRRSLAFGPPLYYNGGPPWKKDSRERNVRVMFPFGGGGKDPPEPLAFFCIAGARGEGKMARTALHCRGNISLAIPF